MAELPRPAFLPDRTVRVAAAMLPAAARNRYEREFLSELFGRSTWQQTRYAVDILIHTVSLRTAVRQKTATEEITMTEQPHRPLTCRLNVRHRWVAQTDHRRRPLPTVPTLRQGPHRRRSQRQEHR